MKKIVTIHHRDGGTPCWSGEVEAPAGAPQSVLLGLAVIEALRAGAYLTGANLAGANLAGANLTGATWLGLPCTRPPLQVYGLRWPVTILDTHIAIGCQLHLTEDWRGFDDRTIAGMDGRDALRFWRAHRDWVLAAADAHQQGEAA